MKSEILFKAKRANNDEWIEGDLLHDYWVGGDTFIPFSIRYKINGVYSFPIEVLPETVCQYTGLNDKNGVKVFEGDLISFEDDPIDEVVYDKTYSGFVFKRIDIPSGSGKDIYADWLCLQEGHQKHYVHKGNIHD